MKKLISIFLVIATMIGLVSCSLAPNVTSKTEKPKSDYETAKEAYELLMQAETLCTEGMDDIYNAWRFGIYEADDCSSSTVFYQLSLETSFSSTDLETNGGFSSSQLVYGSGSTEEWQICVWVIQNCLRTRGDFDKVDSLLKQSKELVQSLSADYEYSKAFKNYYTKVSSYAEFFKSPSGSFNQLQTTVADYENSIRTAKEEFKFDFE